MKYVKEVTKEILGPAMDLVNGAVVFKDFLHGAAVAEPVEFVAPEEFMVLADSPAATSGFDNK
jgi:hypothetical protein